MRILQSLTVFLFIAITTYAAQVKISDLPLNVSPTDATYLEVADMGASPKSGKYLLSNLVERAHIPTSGLFKGNGGLGATAAVAGTDYVQPGSIIGNGFTMPTSRLLGRTTAGTGDIEPITVGTGLTLSGGVLEATGGGGGGGTWGSITGDIEDQTDLIGLFNLKAPVASPTFTGTAVFDIIEANELTLEYAEFGEMTVTTNMHLPYLATTNKLVGVGTTTNIINGTFAMWTNTAGIFGASTTTFLANNGTFQTPAGSGGGTAGTLITNGAAIATGDIVAYGTALTNTAKATLANLTNAAGIFTGVATAYFSGAATIVAIPMEVGAACSDETSVLSTGTAKVTFRMPRAMTVTAVRASLTTAQATGNIFTVDINEGLSSILSTKITIDNTEKTSTTAVTPPVISDSSLADDAEMSVDIDQIGDGTAAGLKIWILGNR